MVELASFLSEKDIEKSMSKIDDRFNEIKRKPHIHLI